MSRSWFRLAVAFTLMTLLCAPALAMSQATADFLRSAGIDPDSEAVKLADAEGTIQTTYNGDPVSYSFDKLAADGAKNGAKRFVVTRTFIRALKANFATPIPPEGYDGAYLTQDEKKLALRKVFGN